MKILWIPNASKRNFTRTSDFYLFDGLKHNHEIHLFCWDTLPNHRLSTLLNPKTHVSSLRYRSCIEEGIYLHHLPRVHNYLHLFKDSYGKFPLINQRLLNYWVKRIIREKDIDILICSQSFDLIGFPSSDLTVPCIFYYVDYLEEKYEKAYLSKCDAVICVSTVLADRAKRWHNKVYYLPTPINLDLFKKADGNKIRLKFNMQNDIVLSLIGITAHREFYWIGGINMAMKDNRKIKCIFVGDNPRLLPRIKKAVEGNGRYVFTGYVPYSEIPNYFAATDVGLNPGFKDIQGDAMCPIKVLEYTAARKPVVTPALEELKRWNFPNLLFIEETPESFAQAIELALTKRFDYPDLKKFDINYVTGQLLEILNKTLNK